MYIVTSRHFGCHYLGNTLLSLFVDSLFSITLYNCIFSWVNMTRTILLNKKLPYDPNSLLFLILLLFLFHSVSFARF
jgi:hypothetical protein